jgi:hypothetical protein
MAQLRRVKRAEVLILPNAAKVLIAHERRLGRVAMLSETIYSTKPLPYSNYSVNVWPLHDNRLSAETGSR